MGRGYAGTTRLGREQGRERKNREQPTNTDTRLGSGFVDGGASAPCAAIVRVLHFPLRTTFFAMVRTQFFDG